MRFKRSIIHSAVLCSLGSAAALTDASAAILSDGVYNVFVNVTPITTVSSYTNYVFGKDGAWNSNFTYGGNAPSASSVAFTDNGLLLDPGDGSGLRGTSIASDGAAGVWQLSIAGTSVSFLSFREDAVFGTPFGDIVQYGTLTGTGALDQTTGALTVTPTGRFNMLSGFPGLGDIARNIDDVDCDTNGCTTNGNTTWTPLTTLSASAPVSGGGDTTINGANIASLGDVDGDGLGDYSAIFVSGGQYGSAWGAGITGVAYFEVYNVRIEAASAVPVPPAMWLFGSGLAGLAALARRGRLRA